MVFFHCLTAWMLAQKHGVMENHATSVERFDPVSNKWEQVCEETPISRAFMSAVVVDV